LLGRGEAQALPRRAAYPGGRRRRPELAWRVPGARWCGGDGRMRLVEPLSDTERARFITAARSLLRTPFRHTGRTPRGVDCVGLVVVALQAVGREVSDRRDYGRNPVRDGLRDVLVAHFGEPVWRQGEAVDTTQPGDIALMRWHEPNGVRLFCHVGILTSYPLGGHALLHALHAHQRVVEHRLADPWARPIVQAYRP